MKHLIVTADDFGLSQSVNHAIEDAHRNGCLTSASLMVAEDWAADAIERARALPSLAVGLHVTLVDGKPMLPPSRIPDLVEADGCFGLGLMRLGIRIALDKKVRRQVEDEVRAQFERYALSGLPLGHVDSHHHYHLHPTVFDVMLDLAVEFGAPAIRVPWEPPLASYRATHDKAFPRIATGLFHLNRARRMKRKIADRGLFANDWIFGLADSGGMTTAKLAAYIGALPDGVSELYCHPASPAEGPREIEYRALIDPKIRALLTEKNIRLTSYASAAAERGDLAA
jgi:hopanoid biosynthesis associated protein HpnK